MKAAARARKPWAIGPCLVGGSELLLIMGPCVIESARFVRRMARKLCEVANGEGVRFIFKASYDKANRTSGASFRGPGLHEGCKILADIRGDLGVPVTSDVHLPSEVEIAAAHLDLLQIPAFLCRQSDLLAAAGASGLPVNVKKGQFLAPWDVRPIAQKLEAAGCRHYFFTERGTTFGYNNLVADMRSLAWMQELGYFAIFDATHSVQRPGGAGTHTTGDGRLAPLLAKAATAAGADGIFLETHENPAKALSDGPNQIPLRELPALLRQLRQIRHAIRPSIA